ncbi:MAG TPA: MarR family transcriptional regulator [Magnetospirillum sp.]|jgi:MarR family transcriptional regulator for hemolysin|nr:MarR family transcriptional regulator [Magnetospirillum sp.]
MLSPECSAERRDFGLHMLRLARRWRDVVDAELRDYGVTQATWRALFYIGELGEGGRPKDLAAALEMERPSLTQLLDRLEKSGLVARREDPSDHRCKLVFLTDRGREIYRGTQEASSRVARRLMADVSDAELAVVRSVFARIATAAEQAPPS